MTEKPPPPRVNSTPAATDAPPKKTKKPWSKPTISTIDGVVDVESALNPASAENASYRPSTS